MKDRYDEAELREAVEELTELKNEGLLFSPEFEVPPTFSETPVLKSLCLHIAHDCNLRCGYCFAGTGDFGGCRALMSKEVAEKAVEFAITGSKKRHNLELDLFGGEPLMNWPVVEHVINYVRRREQETGKNIKLTLTTNGTLLNDENIKFLNDNRVMLVLSLDGKKKRTTGCVRSRTIRAAMMRLYAALKKLSKAVTAKTIICAELIPITIRIFAKIPLI